ncbi:large T antigen [Piliocolobus rufomitratus polyomavirus 1]|uniref:Large T antigen n=1 Tax=Piliocolobus rufomitratus polyomavirus 1 TaxID=1236407 RepID=K7QJ82_9POLY|nr:large T antigen [Piliocolobus rufomitratus polyomavirus 1]AFU25598.2 large T antigen [Piliocolobus rufomitratus polyomavirus 1]
MERVLQKSEKTQLMELLGIPKYAFGNFPIMKTAYKRASKSLHPDKGGSTEKMMLLNSLWQKFQEGFIELRNSESFSEAYGSQSFKRRYQDWYSSVFTNEGPHKGADLHCNESPISSSDEEEPTSTWRESSSQSSGYNSFPYTSTPTSASQDESSAPFSEPEQSETPSSSGTGSSGHEGETPEKRRRSAEDVDGSNSSSQASFASTPPKPKKTGSDIPTDLPSCLFDFVSHAVFSNKTVNSFILYSTLEKAQELYDKIDKFKVEFKSLHKSVDAVLSGGGLVLFLTTGRHRLSAIKNFCQNFCTVSFLICKVVLKPLECYNCLCKLPFVEIKASKAGLYSFDFDDNAKEETCNWNKVAEFAVAADLDDPYIILAHYLDFAKPYPCNKCDSLKTKAHEYHKEHHANAVFFEACKNQKSICTQASDVVIAKRRLLLQECSREELLVTCFEKHLKALKNLSTLEIYDYMAGVAWYANLFDNFDNILVKIIQLLTENVPKNRNILFRGPVNSGKTTFAAALMDLLGGRSLNVNCPADKLNFELGCAIDRFCVVFEDVKGQNTLNKKLQPGQGISNLDNMRDYLDGAVPVNLERKHVNKRSQIFPPCVCTMNEYFMPETLYVRFAYKLNFQCKTNLQKSLDNAPYLLANRILQRGLTLFLLLMWFVPNNKFAVSIRNEIAEWKTIIEKTVSYSDFCKMLENVEVGESPLTNILQEDEPDD